MADERPTEVLEQEHRSVQKVIAAITVLADRLESGSTVRPELVEEVGKFMQMVYQGHERKEELYLFPAMQKRGLSVQSATSRKLVEDHQKGRALVTRLEKAVAQMKAGADSREDLIACMRGLAALYPLHIWQEDLLLFHLAENSLTPEDEAELLRQFSIADEENGGDARRRLAELASKIEQESW